MPVSSNPTDLPQARSVTCCATCCPPRHSTGSEWQRWDEPGRTRHARSTHLRDPALPSRRRPSSSGCSRVSWRPANEHLGLRAMFVLQGELAERQRRSVPRSGIWSSKSREASTGSARRPAAPCSESARLRSRRGADQRVDPVHPSAMASVSILGKDSAQAKSLSTIGRMTRISGVRLVSMSSTLAAKGLERTHRPAGRNRRGRLIYVDLHLLHR